MWIRSSALAIALALAASCGSQASPGSDHRARALAAGVPARARALRLEPGHYTFRLGRDVHVGERILCRTRDGVPAGGGGVEPRGRGVGSSTGFEAITSASGRVRVVCPANPGNA
jgi:hypothetical protein